jgi:hypothetical protein
MAAATNKNRIVDLPDSNNPASVRAEARTYITLCFNDFIAQAAAVKAQSNPEMPMPVAKPLSRAPAVSLVAHRDISRRRSNSVAFGAKRTLSHVLPPITGRRLCLLAAPALIRGGSLTG